MFDNDSVPLISISENQNELNLRELSLNSDLNHACKYYDLKGFNELINHRSENFSLLSLNTRSNAINSLSSKISYLIFQQILSALVSFHYKKLG